MTHKQNQNPAQEKSLRGLWIKHRLVTQTLSSELRDESVQAKYRHGCLLPPIFKRLFSKRWPTKEHYGSVLFPLPLPSVAGWSARFSEAVEEYPILLQTMLISKYFKLHPFAVSVCWLLNCSDHFICSFIIHDACHVVSLRVSLKAISLSHFRPAEKPDRHFLSWPSYL